MLTIALCVTAITSCGKQKPKKIIEEINEMYSNSAPTMVVTTTKQVFNSYELNCRYELKNGMVDGKAASVYTTVVESPESIENAGGSDIVKPFINRTEHTTIAVEGIGTKTDNGNWDPAGTITSIGRGSMALNLDKDTITDVVYENNVLTFVIPNEHIDTVLGAGASTGIEGDVKVTLVNDGAVVTSVELRYTLAGDSKANLGSSEMIIFVEYPFLAGDVDIVKCKQLHNAGGCAREKIVLAQHNFADVFGMEGINVLLGIDAVDDLVFVYMLRQGELNEYAVHRRIGVKLIDLCKERILVGIGGHSDLKGGYTHLKAALMLISYVNCGCRIVTDEDHRKSGRITKIGLELLNAGGYFASCAR